MNTQNTLKVIQEAGGPSAVAKFFGITPSAVSQWKHIPVERVNALSKLTGIPREKLRPDIFA